MEWSRRRGEEEDGRLGSRPLIPDGSGPSLASLDAVITVLINECPGVPIAGVPASSIWLSGTDDAPLRFCEAAGIADGPTDANGATTFSRSLAGGGWSIGGLQVHVGEAELGAPLPFRVVSPDINGDLAVDLADLGDFAIDYRAGAAVRSDFDFDDRLGLGDIAVMAIHFGVDCR